MSLICYVLNAVDRGRPQPEMKRYINVKVDTSNPAHKKLLFNAMRY